MSESDLEQWFADLPPWPTSGTTPMHELARESSSVLVASKVAGSDTALSSEESGSASPSQELDAFLTSQAERLREDTRQKRENAAGPRTWHKRRGTLVGAGAGILVIAVIATVLGVALSGSDERESTTARPSPVGPTESTTASITCPASVNGAVTTGAGAGDQSSGPNVIKAFNYAYYVDKSAQKAKAVTTPNAVAAVDVMQKFIDQRGVGTSHCLSITDQGNNTYGVTLTETPPNGGAPIVYQQTISTVQAGGKYWITSIKSEN